MIKNISISTFINVIFTLGFISILITFTLFINFDRQKHELNMQDKYELIAENFLSTFQNLPDSDVLIKLFRKFEVQPVVEREMKLNIINNAQELIITSNSQGMYRVYKFNEEFYIYVQQFGYNLMLKDVAKPDHNITYIIFGFTLSFIVLVFLFITVKKKLIPLKKLNNQIIEFSKGNRNIKIDSIYGEDEIGTIANSFQIALNIIENQAKSKDLFMRNMMHELKTPITKAMFIAETIGDDKKRLTLQKSFKRMDDIIKELSTVEKLTSKNHHILKEHITYIELFNKTVELTMMDLKSIETNEVDFNLYIDIYMFTIVLKNLIDNAVKFSSDKKAHINASKEKIIVSSYGPKLKEELDYYTDAFTQEEKRKDGFGLGLYIVKTVVDLHGFNLEYKYVDGMNNFIINIKKD